MSTNDKTAQNEPKQNEPIQTESATTEEVENASSVEPTLKTSLISRRGLLGGLVGGAVVVGLGAESVAAAPRKVRTQTTSEPTVTIAPTSPSTAAPSPATSPASAPTPTGQGIFVLLTLYGGNDGLDTVVPTDPLYLAARGALAYQPTETLPLDPAFGLNPEMTGFKGLWDQKRLGIVHGVGYPEPSRSHFRSMDIWQSAVPDRVEINGWLGRWHDATGGDPLRMINIGASIPRAMVSVKGGGGAALPNGNVAIPGGKTFTKAFAELGTVDPTLGPWGARIASNVQDLRRVVDQVGPILKGDVTAAGSVNLEGGATANGTNKSQLDKQFDEVARLIRGGAPTRVYGVALGGFDTHANERQQHRALLGSVDRAVTNFVNEMAADPRGGKVTVLIYSEFGRRVNANLSNGTDHGAAAPVFVVGASVKGGFYGDPPSLSDLNDGDLKFTTDFRRVYASILGGTLGLDPVAVLGKAFEPIPLL
jgi:uncharacterized protein (DUF1501 family)